MNIQNALANIGITELSDMQQAVGNAFVASDNDIVVLSPTGTGKTLAYLLPLLNAVDTESDELQAVVIVPGRELAQQSAMVVKDMRCGVRSYACYGGRPTMDEHRQLRQQKPHVIFATPGRLNDHLDKENINSQSIKYLVIDEFDKCLMMGFHDEMSRLIRRLPFVTKRILLSATDADSIPQFVKMGRTTRLDYTSPSDESTGERLQIFSVHSPERDKLSTLRHLLLNLGNASSIVFLNHRDAVERVAAYLTDMGFMPVVFHGGLDQRQREEALYRFVNKSAYVLVCTDLASRGLDIPDVSNIIHYHLPEGEQGYIHRVGRTARWDAKGRSFFILSPGEVLPSYLDNVNIPDYEIPVDSLNDCPLQPVMTTLYIGKGKHDKLSKGDIVGFLCKKGGLTAAEIGRIDVNEWYSYVAVLRTKSEQVLRQVSNEKIKGLKTVIEEK